MQITKIEFQKKHDDRVNLYIDDEFYAGVSVELILKSQLKKGQEISKEILDELILEDEKGSAFSKSVKYLSSALKTERQIKDYLRRLITYSIVGMLYSLTVVLNLSAFVVNTVDEEKTLTLIAMETESLSNIIIPLIFGMTCDKLKNLKYVCSKKLKPEKTLESLDTSIITIPELKDLESIYT
jgi:hypothetical protein